MAALSWVVYERQMAKLKLKIACYQDRAPEDVTVTRGGHSIIFPSKRALSWQRAGQLLTVEREQKTLKGAPGAG